MATIRNTDQITLERRPPACDRHPSAHALVLVESALFAGRLGATPVDGPRGQLTLCGHCYERHALMLDASGWSVVADTRARLVAAESARRMGCLP